ncbi:phage tail assembly chaperone [Cereibacter sphaeroides]|uniref:phage tail assembly chaperone n=1 Tax=Cereibacter sphaeroides TaxID=1063 RepID=UPI0000663F59|nr:hypothetical protein Rsph17029_0289 [Cereibacter sphaeroides ATCC 17029]
MDPMKRLERQLCAALAEVAAGRNPPVPEAGRVLWQAFWQLSRRRTYHAAGPNPLSWTEIEAWTRLMRTPFEPHHVRILAALDDAFLDHLDASRGGSSPAMHERSGHPLTPELMDALFG